jgi:hypothetical protein
VRRSLRIGIAVTSVCVVIISGELFRERYYERHTWPKKIQVELLGRAIVTSTELQRFESSRTMRGSSFSWFYRPGSNREDLTQYCPNQSLQTCTFAREGHPENRVTTYIYMESGVVNIQEVWY